MKPFIPAAILCLFLGSASAADIPGLVEKVAAAYGGKASLEKIVAIREEGKVESTMGASGPGQQTRTFARPLKLRVEINRGPQSSEIRIVAGEKGWRNGKEATGAAYEGMVLQAVRLDLPWELWLHRTNLVERAAKEVNSHSLRVLELPLENGLTVSAGIDPESGQILYSSGKTSGGSTGSPTFETYYDEFRTVDGVLFAFKETNFAQGTKIAETRLSKIELLKAAPTEAFKP
jgi:hypothetical protein